MAEDKRSAATLWHPKVGRVKNLNRFYDIVSRQAYPPQKGLEHGLGMRVKQTADVLHDEVLRPQLSDQPCEMVNEQVAFVVQVASTANGKPLAWWSPEDDVDRPVPEASQLSQALTGLSCQVRSECRDVPEVPVVGRDVPFFDIERSRDLEAGLLEA